MPLTSGTRLGPYEMLASIGAGGMGEVWKARDTRLGRTVAIKQLAGAHSARFEQEARAVAALNHPHICQIFDIGPDYLVLEYVEGKPLSGPLPAEEALRLAIQIAGALEEAHGKGILHRDLKPANILVTAGSAISTGTRPGSAKLLDFGLAKLMGDGEAVATKTIEGTVLGTAAYMAPEQAQGQPLDERSDIFSFGAVLYEMFSGRRAFPGEHALSALAAIIHKEPEPLQAPADIVRIVMRCLQKAPADRYRSVAEVRAALEAARISAPSAEQPSIAVLPFANLSADKENEYFSDGLAEDILNALAKVPGLRVTARTSTLAFRGREQDIRTIGRALNVDHILEGSVRKSGNRLRVTAQLIKVSDGYQLWSERYDREITDVFAIQDEISQAIAETLKLKLSGQPLLTRPTTDLEAYNLYLRGRDLLGKMNPEGLRVAREHFERALARDPNYALAHAGVGNLLLAEVFWGRVAPRTVLPEAKRALERALELDPSLPQAHAYLGCVLGYYDYDWVGAEREMKRALELGPAVADVHYCYSVHVLRSLGRLEEASLEMKRAMELDPLSVEVILVMGDLARRQHDVDAAISFATKGLGLDSTHYFAHWTLGLTYFLKGTISEAIAEVERAAACSERDPWVLATLQNMYSRTGRSEEAAALMTELEQRAQRSYVAPGVFGVACMGLGRVDDAFNWYEKAVEARDPFALQLPTEPGLGRLRSHPRYQALRRKMRLPE